MAYAWQQNAGLGGGGAAVEEEDTAEQLLREASDATKTVPVNAKLHRCIELLKAHGRSRALTLANLEALVQQVHQTRLTLVEDEVLVQRLSDNPRVKVVTTQDGRIGYLFGSEFPDVVDRASLLAEIERHREGLPIKRFTDDRCYPTVAADLDECVRTGDVLAIKNTETREAVVFRRALRFFVAVGGEQPQHVVGGSAVRTAVDVRKELRRGDAVGLIPPDANGQPAAWFRVSSALAGGLQRQWAEAPASVSSVRELGRDRKESDIVWAEEYSQGKLPLDRSCAGTGPVALCKFGCTNDIRELWLASASKLPRDDSDLERQLRERGMLAPAAPRQKRPRQTNGKQPRRIQRKMRRVTNAHLA